MRKLYRIVDWKALFKNKLKIFKSCRPEYTSTDNELGSDTEEIDDEYSKKDIKHISETNLNAAVELLNYRLKWAQRQISEFKSYDNVQRDDLTKLILNPCSESKLKDTSQQDLNEVFEAVKSVPYEIHDKSGKVDEYMKDLDSKKSFELTRAELLSQQQDIIFKGRYQNYHFLSNINEGGEFETNLLNSGVRCALLLTDTFYTRDTDFYKRIINIFKKNHISFVEYTNLQPNLDRKLIFRIHEFANDHDVNAVIAIGSMSTIDLSKLLMPKLMRPNIIRLHKNREINPALASKYSIFSIPTFVVPEPGINSRSAIRNSLLLPNSNSFGNVLYLKNEIDDGNGVFYCLDVFEMLNRDKLMEVLHETFFRLFFCYFDLSAKEELQKLIIKNLKIVEGLIEMMSIGNEISKKDKQALLEIISFTMDGRVIVDIPDYWLLYRLEGALSLLVNSRKSDGVALFFPAFLEILSEQSFEFRQRAVSLGSNLWGVFSIEGCIYRLSMHIKKYGLPSSLIDISQVKTPNYKFMSELLRRAQVGSCFSSLSRAIMQHINIL